MMQSTESEFNQKLNKLFSFMNNYGYEALVIGRKDNFAWISCGGNNELAIPSESGAGIIIITYEKKYLIAQAMDIYRLRDEELPSKELFELISLKWYEDSPLDRVAKLLDGKKFLCDVAVDGGMYAPGVFYNLHFPLTNFEIERYVSLGKLGERIFLKIASEIKSGIREIDVASMFAYEFMKENIKPVCYIIGSDDRIFKYRHCIASEKKIDRMVMLAPAFRKYGLTMPMTRMIYFGDKLPEEIAARYDAVCQIESATLSSCIPGAKFADILNIQKTTYALLGYDEEWKKHAQGGITGYLINDPLQCLDPVAAVKVGQSFNWYITISGVKVEETALSDKEGVHLLTVNGDWPTKAYESAGKSYMLPQIMLM